MRALGWIGALGMLAACGPGEVQATATGSDSAGMATDTTGGGSGTAAQDETASTGTSSTGPEIPPPTIDAVGIAAGERFTCALLDAGGVRCWGTQHDGVMGQGTDVGAPCASCDEQPGCCLGDDEPLAEIPAIALGGVATEVSTGLAHACARLEDGALRCWGVGQWGALGLGATETIGDDDLPVAAPTVDLGAAAVSVAASGGRSPGPTDYGVSRGRHTCAVLVRGQLQCWGDGTLGTLGRGTIDVIGDDEPPSAAGPVPVGGAVIQVAVGGRHTCALLEGGTVRCWGFNEGGVLGLGDGPPLCQPGMMPSCSGEGCCHGHDQPAELLPTVALGGTVVSLAAGGDHTCAVLDGGGVRCWGEGSGGRLGLGATDDVGDDELPTDRPLVDVGGPVVALAAGDEHTCALLEGGAVRCWGDGFGGRLGYGHTEDIGDDEPPSAAGDVPLGGTAIAIAVGRYHTCALLDDATVRCFGHNGAAQLGLPVPAACYDEDGGFRCEHHPRCCVGDDEVPADVPPVPL